MSAHYDFALACDFPLDLPQQVIDTLSYLTRGEEYAFETPPDHPFFEYEGWRNFLHIQPDETYFPGEVGSAFRRAYRYTQAGVDSSAYTLSFRLSLLDDTLYNAGVLLLEWLARWSISEHCVGYWREEFDLHPTLLYFRHGQVYLGAVTHVPVDMYQQTPW